MNNNYILLNEANDIVSWLHFHKVDNYTIVEEDNQLVVSVSGRVDLNGKGINSIAVKFNCINGHFDCSANNLTTLKGAPVQVKVVSFAQIINLQI